MDKKQLEIARDIFVQVGESRFDELRKREKIAVYEALCANEWSRDADRNNVYRYIKLDDLFPGKFEPDDQITIESHDRDVFSAGLSDMWFEFGEDDRPGDWQTHDAVAAIDYILSKIDAPINVVNLTPHEIVIVDDAGGAIARFPASGQTARVNSRAVDLPPVAGVPAVRTEYGDIDGLPKSQPGTIYIVSVIVAQALKQPRPDVYIPDTGPDSVVRDADGKIVGVKRLMQL